MDAYAGRCRRASPWSPAQICPGRAPALPCRRPTEAHPPPPAAFAMRQNFAADCPSRLGCSATCNFRAQQSRRRALWRLRNKPQSDAADGSRAVCAGAASHTEAPQRKWTIDSPAPVVAAAAPRARHRRPSLAAGTWELRSCGPDRPAGPASLTPCCQLARCVCSHQKSSEPATAQGIQDDGCLCT